VNASRPFSPILTLKLVAMATSLERSKKVRSVGLIYDQIYGENVVKIGPVDPEVMG